MDRRPVLNGSPTVEPARSHDFDLTALFTEDQDTYSSTSPWSSHENTAPGPHHGKTYRRMKPTRLDSHAINSKPVVSERLLDAPPLPAPDVLFDTWRCLKKTDNWKSSVRQR